MKVTFIARYLDDTQSKYEKDILPPTYAKLMRVVMEECANPVNDLDSIEVTDGDDTILQVNIGALAFHGWTF